MTKAQRRARVKALETKVFTGWRKSFMVIDDEPIPEEFDDSRDILIRWTIVDPPPCSDDPYPRRPADG
ncbi:hypothetical protein [Sphingosinicella sp. BN140058]|uniref:hypothetical protein n=1 Tax=Sphingosinicella sp. BN140058 TaxID=1892855 RepID=UPI001013BB37|nr:hypothetical protein [Sphingosinicella sp. BN140058]QAY78673.1 hypothetical protein ETR14_20615 [Sphingosinicella sp. BN140058]